MDQIFDKKDMKLIGMILIFILFFYGLSENNLARALENIEVQTNLKFENRDIMIENMDKKLDIIIDNMNNPIK